MKMKNSKNKSLILVLVLLAALAGALVLVRTNQETRRGAYFSAAELQVLPDSISAKVGEQVLTQIWVNTQPSDTKVNAVDTKLCYGEGLVIDGSPGEAVQLNQNAFKILLEASDDTVNHCIHIVALSSGIAPENLQSSAVQVASIRFRAVKEFSGKIEMALNATTVGGYNPEAGSTDASIKLNATNASGYVISAGGGEIGTCGGSKPADKCDNPQMLQINAQCYAGTTEWDYNDQLCDAVGRKEVCGGVSYCCPVAGGDWTTDMTACGGGTEPTQPPTGDDAVLNFKIAYRSLTPDAKCYANWPVKLIVMGGGVTKVYTNVALTPDQNDPKIMRGSVVLTGFNAKNGVAVFFKNSKSLQNKYGVNNQGEIYNKAGGELTLTNSAQTSPVYDFTGYPLMPGDVVSENSEVQDGVVNGLDFAYLKSKVVTHQTVNPGEYLQGDLDGNCQLNSGDVTVFKRTLEEKQGQLY